jgi:hypothetical protein
LYLAENFNRGGQSKKVRVPFFLFKQQKERPDPKVCGEILAQHFPRPPDDQDELANKLVVER